MLVPIIVDRAALAAAFPNPPRDGLGKANDGFPNNDDFILLV